MSELERVKALNKARELLTERLEDGNIKTTGIGLFVNKLRQKLNGESAELAKKIIIKWKADIQQGAKALAKNDSTDSSSGTGKLSSANVSTKPTPQPAKTVVVAKPLAQPTRPKERTPTGDGLKVPALDDPYREKVCGILYSALALGNTIDGSILLPLACEIESTVFGNCGGVNEAYRSRITTLNFNLRDLKNPELNERVIAKTLPVSQLCVMTSEQLASESKKKQLEDMRKTSLFKSQGAASAQAETDMFKCGKCKQRKCTYFQKQTRSADEPMTTFVTCVNCDHHWKVIESRMPIR
ncbi:transcription elongation factor TFIIS [Massospora cicadina]|nr:transcription elongation factor TFIIS [Massospora cicadina]